MHFTAMLTQYKIEGLSSLNENGMRQILVPAETILESSMPDLLKSVVQCEG